MHVDIKYVKISFNTTTVSYSIRSGNCYTATQFYGDANKSCVAHTVGVHCIEVICPCLRSHDKNMTFFSGIPLIYPCKFNVRKRPDYFYTYVSEMIDVLKTVLEYKFIN
jgi:hypothetical protein